MTLEEALWQDDERMSGAVCFRGTRIPVSILFDYISSGEMSLFNDDFPDVSPVQIDAVLKASLQLIELKLTVREAA